MLQCCIYLFFMLSNHVHICEVIIKVFFDKMSSSFAIIYTYLLDVKASQCKQLSLVATYPEFLNNCIPRGSLSPPLFFYLEL